jgi:hypothetical protein
VPTAQRFSAVSCSTQVVTPVTHSRLTSYFQFILYGAILKTDRALRSRLGIFEFSDDPDCMLRIARAQSNLDVVLPDSTHIHEGDPVIELHFWNEHVAARVLNRPPFARAKLVSRYLHHSFHLLAEYLSRNPETQNTKAIHARVVMPFGARFPAFQTLARMYGFSSVHVQSRTAGHIHDFFENFLVRGLLFAFNPTMPTKRGHHLSREELWMNRDEFLRRYGGVSGPSPDGRGGQPSELGMPSRPEHLESPERISLVLCDGP